MGVLSVLTAYYSQSKQKVKRRADPVLSLLILQTLDGEKKQTKTEKCPLTWTPVLPVLTGCPNWESAVCALGKREEEEEEGRRTRKKTEGGRKETFYPQCRTPPLLTVKGNPLTAMPL